MALPGSWELTIRQVSFVYWVGLFLLTIRQVSFIYWVGLFCLAWLMRGPVYEEVWEEANLSVKIYHVAHGRFCTRVHSTILYISYSFFSLVLFIQHMYHIAHRTMIGSIYMSCC